MGSGDICDLKKDRRRWASVPVFVGPVRGKAAKRRRWRKKRAGFEEAPRFADVKRPETGNGATVERAASAKLYNPYQRFLYSPTTRNRIIPFSKPELQDILVNLNDLTARFLLFIPDNLLFGALFSEGFSFGYPKNNAFVPF